MAIIDWTEIGTKLNTEMTNDNQNLMVSEFSSANGASKKYRSFTEIASLKTIANNQAAAEKNNSSGMIIFAEMDWNI